MIFFEAQTDQNENDDLNRKNEFHKIEYSKIKINL